MPLFGVKTTTVETTKLTPRSLEENHHAAQGVVNWASELIASPKKDRTNSEIVYLAIIIR
jgi:hypothetical protein